MQHTSLSEGKWRKFVFILNYIINQPLITWVPGALSPRVKLQGRETCHSTVWILYIQNVYLVGGTQKRNWLRHYAISRKIEGPIPDEVMI
jgi:hypothetical protein